MEDFVDNKCLKVNSIYKQVVYSFLRMGHGIGGYLIISGRQYAANVGTMPTVYIIQVLSKI